MKKHTHQLLASSFELCSILPTKTNLKRTEGIYYEYMRVLDREIEPLEARLRALKMQKKYFVRKFLKELTVIKNK